MKIIKKQIPDKSSPLGYWDINKSCPVIVAAPRQDLLQSLNKNIMALVNQYTCENKGEETVYSNFLSGDYPMIASSTVPV